MPETTTRSTNPKNFTNQAQNDDCWEHTFLRISRLHYIVGLGYIKKVYIGIKGSIMTNFYHLRTRLEYDVLPSGKSAALCLPSVDEFCQDDECCKYPPTQIHSTIIYLRDIKNDRYWKSAVDLNLHLGEAQSLLVLPPGFAFIKE